MRVNHRTAIISLFLVDLCTLIQIVIADITIDESERKQGKRERKEGGKTEERGRTDCDNMNERGRQEVQKILTSFCT